MYVYALGIYYSNTLGHVIRGHVVATTSGGLNISENSPIVYKIFPFVSEISAYNYCVE